MTPRHLLEPGRLAGAALLKAQSDARLIDMTRAGNDRAFEAIVDRYKGPLGRYCTRILPDGRGDDAVQQTFLKAYNALHDDTTPLSLRAWLFGIAHNVSLNILRQRGSDHEPLEAHAGTGEPADATIEKRERFREVVAAIAALPAGQRDALLLRELEGRGHDEIARELGITGGAARQLISRARNGVRAAAAAVIPYPLVMRLTDGSVPAPSAARLAELTAAGGGITVAKVVATAAVGGTLIGGAVKGPDVVSAGRDGGNDSVPAAEASMTDDVLGDESDDSAARRESSERGDDRRGRRAGGDDDRRGEAEPGDDHGGDGDEPGDDHGGRGGDDDHSGSGGGDDDGGSRSGPGDGSRDDDGSNSGPGSGGDDGGSGSGSGDDGSGTSGSGGSGTSGGDDGVDDISGSDGTSGTSGSGTSGSGDSGSDGSGTSGSGTSGSSTSGSGSDDLSGSSDLSDNSGPGSLSDDD